MFLLSYFIQVCIRFWRTRGNKNETDVFDDLSTETEIYRSTMYANLCENRFPSFQTLTTIVEYSRREKIIKNKIRYDRVLLRFGNSCRYQNTFAIVIDLCMKVYNRNNCNKITWFILRNHRTTIKSDFEHDLKCMDISKKRLYGISNSF